MNWRRCITMRTTTQLLGTLPNRRKILRRSRRRLARIRRKVAGGRFLDIGCNGGFTVEAAREHGFEAFGIELDAVSLVYAQDHFPGNNYFHGRIEDYPVKKPFRCRLLLGGHRTRCRCQWFSLCNYPPNETRRITLFDHSRYQPLANTQKH